MALGGSVDVDLPAKLPPGEFSHFPRLGQAILPAEGPALLLPPAVVGIDLGRLPMQDCIGFLLLESDGFKVGFLVLAVLVATSVVPADWRPSAGGVAGLCCFGDCGCVPAFFLNRLSIVFAGGFAGFTAPP